MPRKTGFVLANLHQGTAVRVWEGLNSKAIGMGDGAVFVLPGGRLGYKKADEYLRNHIYRFASPENMDGVVVWGSTLAGTATWKEAAAFVQNLSSEMPAVSMGITVDGVPSVTFDAYAGTFRMVEHMIQRHGARRIAFLRGPEKHESAQERYNAYIDALRANGIEIDSRLVSSPMVWGEGDLAIMEIVEKNGMQPKTDFDALVCPSDLMNKKASRYLEEKGYLIPDDVATAGFNDSPESYITSVESTTVRMPFKEMVEASFSLIGEMEEKKDGTFTDLTLPSVPIYRRSCGCTDPFGSVEYAQRTIRSWDDYERWLRNRLSDKEAARILITLLHELLSRCRIVDASSRRYYEEMCWRYLKHEGTTKLFFSAIKWARILLNERKLTVDEMDLLHDIVLEQSAKVAADSSIRSSEKNTAYNALGNDLLRSLTYSDMGKAMAKHLPSIGIEKAFLFLDEGNEESRLVTGFSKERIWEEGESFPYERIYPEEMEAEFESGIFIVVPLFYDSAVEGYLVMQNQSCPPEMVENIRNSASATLKTISLYAIASEKSQKAEEAEKKSMAFYATLAEDLKEPLDAIKAMADCGDLDEEILLALSTKAEHILQLSLSDKGELSLETKLVPGELLRNEIEDRGISLISPHSLPALNLDMEKIGEVLDYLAAKARGAGDSLSGEILIEPRNLVLRIKSNVFDVSVLDEKDPSMLLCEKIMVMHSGTFRFGKVHLDMAFPFPSISGQPSSAGGSGGVLFITGKDSSLPEDTGLEKIERLDFDDVVQNIRNISAYSSIAWNIAEESKASNVALTVLRNHKETKAMPFLCYGMKNSSISLNTAVEGALPLSDKAVFYSFGPFPKTLDKLRDFGTIKEVKSPSDILEGESAALFIMQSVDTGAIETLRRRRQFSKTPVLVVADKFTKQNAEDLSPFPEVLMVNTSITESEDFITRIVSLVGGDELLPPLTSVLVKRAIVYLNEGATHSVSRWQIAASVNISEDYLTRIFRKEEGISPWDYLNRYRIQIASELLLETGASISEIASMTGFQDQAYFCRVFRKVKGFPPGNIRSRNQA